MSKGPRRPGPNMNGDGQAVHFIDMRAFPHYIPVKESNFRTAEKRVCGAKGCGAVLSQYNQTQYCRTCTDQLIDNDPTAGSEVPLAKYTKGRSKNQAGAAHRRVVRNKKG